MDQRQQRNRIELVVLLAAGMAFIASLHRGVWLSIVEKWTSDAAFSHGFLVVPICAWLAWRKRSDLAGVAFGPSWLGVLGLAACTAAWAVAHGSGVLVIEQLAVVAMIPALVLTLLGWAATRTLIFPLAMLVFAVPFGRAIVPLLMKVTADLATVGLQWSGVPVLRTHMHIVIPGGWFEVALACSGLSYFTTSLLLGVLFAHLAYQSWLKRLVCVAAFTVIPVLLNGLRVYITILVSHLTDMRFGPGAEHVLFGRIFFVVCIVLVFWIAQRWHDETPAKAAFPGGPGGIQRRTLAGWAALPAAVAVLAIGPSLVSSSTAQARAGLVEGEAAVGMPVAMAGWQGPEDAHDRWRPGYRGGLAERQVAYRNEDGRPVDVFVAVYGLGRTLGEEMISYGNVIVPEQFKSLAAETGRSVELPDGTTLKVKELLVNEGAVPRLVWYWYLVGDRPVLGPFAVKGLEALAIVTGKAHFERIVTLSTPGDDAAAAARLSAFVTGHAACVRAGFSGEACEG